jgi:hypothetical protein
VVAQVSPSGAASAGSRLQLQQYVNSHTDRLNGAIRGVFSDLTGAAIDWRSPLADDGYAEYWDDAFLRHVGLGDRVEDRKAFWPEGGPHWDGLAVAKTSDQEGAGILLIEAKSYPDELYGGGCQAKDAASLELIKRSLGWTQAELGVSGKTPGDWCGPLYQSANRLAHLCWLRSLGIPAWLVHVLFVDDPHRPTTADEWKAAIRRADLELGLDDITVDAAGHVLLPALAT